MDIVVIGPLSLQCLAWQGAGKLAPVAAQPAAELTPDAVIMADFSVGVGHNKSRLTA